MSKFFYVYILQSEIERERFYTGLTDDLLERLKADNAGRIRHSSKWRPRRLKTYIALFDRPRAVTIRAIFEVGLWPSMYEKAFVTAH